MSTSDQSSHDSEPESFTTFQSLKINPVEKYDPSEISELYNETNEIHDPVVQKKTSKYQT